jgi:hypothetical protein
MAAIDDLIKQIQSQGTTSKWSGGFGAEDATKDMARILDSIGITDIKQFGKITKTIPAYSEETEQGRVNIPEQTVTTYGNKVTGQEVPNTYSERQTGNAFGGTFQGKGNTGYRVQFRDDGTPVFYTTGASSNDLANLLADNPLLNIAANVAATAFGGPLGAGALQLAQGKDIGDAAKATLLAYAGKELTSGLGGGGDASLAPSDTGGLIGGSESVFDPTFGGELPSVIGSGAESVFDPTFGGELPAVIGSGAESVFDPTFGGELSPVIGGGAESVFDPTFGGTLSDVAPSAIPAASKFPLSVSDTIRLAGIGTALAGGAKLAGDAISGSGGGYDIVPIPSDWTSPIKSTGVAEFTPLAPIDFGNKEMLRGTQWEQLLSPDYGKAPAMPNVPTNPSNMSFDQLMGVLGNTRTSMPTQNVSINDVIAGIQSQYGQTPTGSVG